MSPLSAVVITFNEEKKIEQCIVSLKKVADEIVVVDSFSTDTTVAICGKLGVKTVQHAFEGYIEQKNFALAFASNKMVLSLDADEMLSDKLVESILEEKKKDFPFHSYTMNRLNNYCGKWIRHCGWYPDRKLRLFNKEKGKWGGVNPHDKFEMNRDSKTKHLNGDILHYSFDSIEAHIAQQKRFSEIAANHMHQAGKKAGFFHVSIKPPVKFMRDYIFKLGFLDGHYGFLISKISARAVKRKYTLLQELNRSR